MDIENLRRLELGAVCALLGLEPDRADPRQFKGHGARIAVNGFKWFDHGAGIGGGGAVDLTMHILKASFNSAVSILNGFDGELPSATAATPSKSKKAATRPPTSDKNNLPAVLSYLTDRRHLNPRMVQWCIEQGLVYADARRNCVFRYGATGAELRGTGAVQWRGVYGTVESGFILPAPNAVGVALLESAIDALSYRQLHRDTITVSLAGNGNHKVIQQAVSLAKSKRLPVLSAFDNDNGGDTAHKILEGYAQAASVELIQDRPTAKDWNDVLKQA